MNATVGPKSVVLFGVPSRIRLFLLLPLLAACSEEDTRFSGWKALPTDAGPRPPTLEDRIPQEDSGPPLENGGFDCHLDEDGLVVLASSGVYTANPPAIVGHDEGVYVAWVGLELGRTPLVSRFVGNDVSSSHGFALGSALSGVREPTMVRDGDVPRVLFHATTEGAVDLVLGRLASGEVARGLAVSGEVHAPAIATTPQGAFIAWLQGQSPAQRGYLAREKASGGLETPVEVIELADAWQRASMVGLEAGFALTWISQREKRPRLLRFSATGAPIDAVVELSSETSAAGPFDTTSSSSGGAFVYDLRIGGIRPEIRVRAFGLDGRPIGLEEVVTSPPEMGSAASIAPFRGGYAIAYRGSSEAGEATKLRVAFVDGLGRKRLSLDVADVSLPAHPTKIAASPDGRFLYIVFNEDQSLRLARLRCADEPSEEPSSNGLPRPAASAPECREPTEGCPCEPGTASVSCKPSPTIESQDCPFGARYCRDGRWSRCESM